MLRHETVTAAQVVAAVCDRCGRDMKRRGETDGGWEERIAIAFRGGYNSVFGDGNAVELDLCQHCVKEVLGPWLRITEDGWPKATPHHAGQEHQRRIAPAFPAALQDFERGGEGEAPPARERSYPAIQTPIPGLRRLFEQAGIDGDGQDTGAPESTNHKEDDQS